MSQMMTLQHDYMEDIQRTLISSIKNEETPNAVNIFCKDSTITCDQLVLALASVFWKDILKSNESDTTCIIAPDYNAEQMRQYLHFCVLESYAGDKESKDDNKTNDDNKTYDDKDSNDDKDTNDDKHYSNVLNTENISLGHILRQFGHQKPDIKMMKELEENSNLSENCSPDELQKDTKKERHEDSEIKSFNVKSKSWTCPYCLKIYRPNYIKTHIRNMHSTEEETQVKCDKCKKKFRTEAGLRLHVKNTHKNRDPHICRTCGAVFLNDISLKRHCTTEGHKFPKVESPSKEYKRCTICNKKILEKMLDWHMELRHSNGRLHKCEDCSFTTKRIDSLNRHRKLLHGMECKEWRDIDRTWTEGKKYTCIYCKKILTKKEEIDDHLVDEICKLTCNICEKRFTLKHHLKRHIKNVHKV